VVLALLQLHNTQIPYLSIFFAFNLSVTLHFSSSNTQRKEAPNLGGSFNGGSIHALSQQQ